MRRLQEPDFDPAEIALLSAPIEARITPLDSSSVAIVNPVHHGPRRISYELETDAPRLLVVSEVFIRQDGVLHSTGRAYHSQGQLSAAGSGNPAGTAYT